MIKNIRNFFCSVKLTIFLLLILAATSILGTVIDQGVSIDRYKTLFSPGVFSILNFFDIFDMYHSWWYTLLLILLSINIAFCTFKQIQRIVKFFFHSNKIITDDVFKYSTITKTIDSKAHLSEIIQQSNALLKSLVAEPVHERKGNAYYLSAEQGKYSRLGTIFVHLSILLILGGGLVGTLWGIDGKITIIEGEKTNKVLLSDDKGLLDLEYEVQCDNFSIDFYETGLPKEYRTDLSIIEKGKKLVSKTIKVNYPFTYKGMKFYQATYGFAAIKNLELIAIRNKTGEKTSLSMNIMKKVGLAGSSSYFAIAKFVPDHNNQGPAVLGVLLKPGKRHEIFWIYKNIPEPALNPERDFTFIFKDFDMSYYSGIKVSRDPGLPFFWSGCILIIIGFLLSLFGTHKRAWLRISQIDNDYKINIAVSVSKNKKIFEETLERLLVKFNVE